jgi:hypothetical protein
MRVEGRGDESWQLQISLRGNEHEFETRCGGSQRCKTLYNEGGSISDRWTLEASRVHHRWTIETGGDRVTTGVDIVGADAVVLASETSVVVEVDDHYVTYGGLSAVDADGRELRAAFELDSDRLEVVIDASQATYPISVDPTITSYNWQAESSMDGARMGSLVRFVGDINGDDWDDLAVGSPGYSNGQAEEGRIQVWYGSDTGLPPTPSWSFESDVAGARLGASLDMGPYHASSALPSVFVGAPGGGSSGEGAVYRFDGHPTGLPSVPSGMVTGTQPGEGFGTSVAISADNQGRYFRLVVGAPYYSDGEQDEGRVVDATEMMRDSTVNAPSDYLESDHAGAEFGYSISSPLLPHPPEFVVIGAPGYSGTLALQGRLYEINAEHMILGSAWGPVGAHAGSRLGESVTFIRHMHDSIRPVLVAGEPGFSGQYVDQGRVQYFKETRYGGFRLEDTAFASFEGAGANARLGAHVCPASDLNGDRFGDVLLGSPGWNQSQSGGGRAQVILGTSSGPQSQAYWTIDGHSSQMALGAAGCSAGDVDGDGFQDLAIGAPGWDGGGTDRGKVLLIRGGGTVPGSTHDWTTTVSQTETYFGQNVSYAGDVNGDGYDDFVVGESEYEGPEESEGRIVAYYGGASGPGLAPSWTYESNTPYRRVGDALDGGGDINGDGYSDLVVGTQLYSNGENNEGRVAVFFGSDTGLQNSPGWTYEPDIDKENVGAGVEQVGDVNGDGYTDFLVASSPYPITPNQAGKVQLFFGSRHGVEDEPVATYLGVEVFQRFGSSLARAGDVNGDGFADFMIGSEAGEEVYVYHGTDGGAPTQEDVILSSTIGWRFGASLDTAGDVNGDGYSDVIVSEWRYSIPTAINVGRVYLYYGSATGISQPADWIVTGTSGKTIGDSVGLAGDLNADGYSDFYVSTGGVYVDIYLGGPTGPGSTPDWGAPDIAGHPIKREFADTVGDVNGDGVDDFVLGAPTAQYGAIYGFYGNRGAGTAQDFVMRDIIENARHQRILRPWGKSSDTPSSSLYLWLWEDHGSGLASRSRAQLETKPLGVAFDGTNFEHGLHYSSNPFKHSVLDANNAPLGPYHLRMRWDFSPVVRSPVQRSRWLYGGYPGEARGTHLRGFHNVAPEGERSFWTIQEDTVLSATLPTYDRDANNLTVTLPTAPATGQVQLQGSSGDFTYTPPLNYHGIVQFTYDVSDGSATSGPYDVEVEVVPVNDAPAFTTTPTTTVQEDQSYTYALEATDPDVGQSLSLTAALIPSWLTLQDHGDGTATLTGTPGQVDVGTDRVELEVRDGEGGVAVQEFYVEVVEVNDVPVAFDASVSTLEDTPVDLPFVGQDVESTTLSFSVSQPPSNGTVTESNGRWSYEPDTNFNGTDELNYTASDGVDTSAPATISLTVGAVNDPPEFVSPTPADEHVYTVSEGSVVSFTVAANDPDMDILALDVTPLPGTSTFDAASGAFHWDVTWDSLGEHDLSLSASDGQVTIQRDVDIHVQIIDEDEDGVSDPWERQHGLDPTDPDSDDDGIMDGHEVGGRDPEAIDTDGDGTIDALDEDSDGDGVLDRNEAGDKLLETPPIDSDRDGDPDFRDSDSDGDGTPDGEDNCRTVRNAAQRDRDDDSIGDLCDEDADGDEVTDDVDNCVGISNPEQRNADGDEFGDRCDFDADGDGVDDAEDSCPHIANTEQADLDGDGMGNACDPDDDGDGVPDDVDRCGLEPGDGEDGCAVSEPDAGGETDADQGRSGGAAQSSSSGCGCAAYGEDRFSPPVSPVAVGVALWMLLTAARRRKRRDK